VLTSIRAKLGAIFAGFLLVGAGSISVTFLSARAQRADALIINLAGRQRMLTQAMTKAAMGVTGAYSADYETELQEAARTFDSTLQALRDGGTLVYGGRAVTLPPTTDPETRTQLEEVVALWGQFREDVETLRTADPDSAAFVQAMREIEATSPVILQEMDEVVQLYEAAAERKVALLYAIQGVFLVSALALLVVGYILIQRSVVNPVTALEAASRRIADGDLETPVEPDPAAAGELGTLARSFETMRQELGASQLALRRWADELETRVEHRTRELVALFEVTSEIVSQLDIQEILASIVDKARQLAGGEASALCLLGQSRGALSAAVTSGPAEAFSADASAGVESFDVASAVEAVTEHEACDCQLLRRRFRRSHLAVPLRTRGRVLGVLCVGHQEEDRFGEEDRRLLTLLANAGAIALDNAYLYEQAEQTAALEERERIVAEIHDGLAQTLSFLNLRLGAVEGLIEDEQISQVPEQLTLIRRSVERSGNELRRLMKDLQSDATASRTLEGQLRRAVKRFVDEWGMAVELRVETEQGIREPPETHEQVTRVVEEALTNVHKHAPSSSVTVTLEQRDGDAVVHIQDDGAGFDVETAAGEEGHFGLKVMAARAERIGGTLDVRSTPGRGTRVTLRWPVTER
jgi:two-component system nitrate/nitrite sensor histidine kinase NarX